MKIIKRDSSEEIFNGEKIYNAVLKANNATENNKLSNEQIRDVAEYVEYKCSKMGRAGLQKKWLAASVSCNLRL